MELMTYKETADFLKTTRGTIETWFCVGTLPKERLVIKLGRKALVDKDELIKFLNEKRSLVK